MGAGLSSDRINERVNANVKEKRLMTGQELIKWAVSECEREKTPPTDAAIMAKIRAYPGGPLPTPKIEPTFSNSCNRHDDCRAADAKARERGAFAASHCHDDCCEDCFGS